MLAQLTVSLMLFAVAMFGRNVFPESMEYWKGLLCQDINFERAFSDFGEAALQGESLWDSFNELCVEVFAGGIEETEEYAPVFDEAVPLTERIHRWERERGTFLRVSNEV